MRKILRHPWLVVAVITLITVFFALQLPRAELDNNNFRFVPKDDPALKTSQKIDDIFGSSLFILVGLERPYGTVFEKAFLNRIREYTDRIRDVPIVEKIISLVDSDYITGDGDSVVVEKLVSDDFTGTDEEVEELKRRVLSWEMYDRTLVSDDFSATQVLVSLNIKTEDSGLPEVTADFLRIRNIAREMFDGLAGVYVTGMPVISATINESLNADLVLLVPLVIIVVLAVLFFSFRHLTPVILPLLTVLIATVWSIGAMPLFGIKLSVLTTVLPVILVAVGSAYGIHVVTNYISDRGKAEISREEHREIIFTSVEKIGKPVFLAALTTFVAFFSFCFTTVRPIREFGYFSSFGVAAALVVAVTLIPALLIIRGPKLFEKKDKTAAGKEAGGREDDLNTVIARSLEVVARKRRTILLLTAFVILFSLYGLSKLVVDNVMVEYFRHDTDIAASDLFIREKFGGSKVVSVVMEADDPETLLHPDSLAALDGLESYLGEKIPQVGKVMGFTDLVKRINQVFNTDESPGGIRPAAGGRAGEDNAGGEPGFGFGDSGPGDFGFGGAGDDPGDFGFGDFGAADSAGTPDAEIAPAAPAEEKNPAIKKLYTGGEIAALLEKAGARKRGMDANDLVREINRQLNYEGAAYYEIPRDPRRYGKENPEDLQRLVSNYLVLLSGNISEYADDPLEPTSVKLTVQLRTLGMNDSRDVFHKIEAYIQENFPPGVRTYIGGTTKVEDSIDDLVVQSQLISMILSLVLVFIILAVSNRSLAAGLIGIPPLFISLLVNFAVMGLAGIKLNIGTSMVAGVSVGVGVDYTIHYLEAFKREYRASGGTGDFLRRTFLTSGKAIIINAISVGAGFAVLLFSKFTMLADLGLLIAITMFLSAFVSLTLLPALLTLVKPKFITAAPRGVED
ncbi:MAG: MMPL family transporter [Treponema sp.]|jgi:predicted RND superfamily exporter protein|nr:MMPL family transporter [Treponema sp.]